MSLTVPADDSPGQGLQHPLAVGSNNATTRRAVDTELMRNRKRHPRRRRHLVWCATLFSIVAIATDAPAQKVYKWTDDAGNVHYGDRPPADSQRHELQLRRAPAVDPDVNTRRQRTERLLQSFAAERAEKQAQRVAAAAAKKQREQRCAEARRIQEKYENSAFIYTKDAAGERVILDDDAHAKVMADSRADVETWCD